MFGRRRRRDEELDEELQAHLRMAIEERIARGEDPREAELAARREFGNEALVRETTRAMWGWTYAEQVAQDVRFALRSARRKPGVTAVVIASLALGIGANLALFSVVYPALLRPLAVPRPGELVELLQKYPDEPRGNGYWSTPSFEFYRDRNTVFSGVTGTAINHVARVESRPSETSVVVGEYVAGNYFSLLELQPALGRLLTPGDAGSPVAVLSWSFWKSRFGADPTVLGQRVVLDEVPVVIVGVAPRDYFGLQANVQTAIWTPVKPNAGLNLIARLKPGVTLAQAREEMKSLFRFTIEERAASSADPQVQKLRVELEPARTGLAGLRDRVGQPLWTLMALVAVLLALACVNVAGILLAQAAAREREMKLRAGLGASRGRLIRQVLTESCLLSVTGAAIGVAIAYFGTGILLNILDSGRPHERIRLLVELDGTVVFFAVVTALGTGLLFGMAPALRTSYRSVFGKGLVAAQIAVALVLLSFGGLFTANLASLKSRDLGFRPDHVLLVSIETGRNSVYRGERLVSTMHALIGRMKALPGVRQISLAAPTPLMGAGASGWVIAEGFEEKPESKRRIAISWVAPNYFATMGTPLLTGRDFSASDEAGAKSAIISESLARYYFAGRDPLGRRITLDKVTMTRDPATYEVIGVVADTNYREIREADRRLVFLSAFGPGRVTARTIVMRTDIDPESVAGDARRVAGEVAPGLNVAKTVTLPAQIDSSIVPERLVATLSGFFAILGALLAGIGLYGLLAYSVTRRTSEIGVRMALGATAGRILRMVLGEAMAVAGVGLLLGVPLVWGSLGLAAYLLEGITTPRSWALGGGAGMLLAVAAVAAFLPARRAARLDAVQCLRRE